PRQRRPPARHLGGRPDPGYADRRRLCALPGGTEAERATLPPRTNLRRNVEGAGGATRPGVPRRRLRPADAARSPLPPCVTPGILLENLDHDRNRRRVSDRAD